jgi:hypothetical protein
MASMSHLMQRAAVADQAFSVAWRVRDMVSVLPMVSLTAGTGE